ncbi:MAG TPA: hypothetical protein PKE27_13790 [Povalibacter sp.]|uniref:hypothetical protein n=1 Tax=Povalibacter sp. TaxID=1962978 RepID=UPI002BF31F79|nr:hypothetical protein [Povalibacter sp.]HMN45652.1 hypothetical protein [Povalibacter sp.]
MEARPPEVIERVVRLLTPPVCREHVLGDLSERYVSPARYVMDVLGTLPFVIGSRLRRTLNPALAAFLAFYFWFGVFWGPNQAHWGVAVVPALVALAALTARDIYRSPAPNCWLAAAGDVAVAAVAVLLSQAALALAAPAWRVSMEAMTIGFPLGFAILYFLRVQLLPGTQHYAAPAGCMSAQELHTELSAYAHIVRRTTRIELGAGVVLAVWWIFCLKQAVLRESMGEIVGLGLCIAGTLFVSVYLYSRGRVTRIPASLDFQQTLALYRSELERRRELSATFLWWYVLPLTIGPGILLIALHLQRPNAAATVPIILLVLVIIAAILALTQRPTLRKLHQRLDQLSVLTEKT